LNNNRGTSSTRKRWKGLKRYLLGAEYGAVGLKEWEEDEERGRKYRSTTTRHNNATPELTIYHRKKGTMKSKIGIK
jgi:hypothetical protein